MDINLLFRGAVGKCGRVLKALPTSEIGSVTEYLRRILEEDTLPSLDILIPYQSAMSFQVGQLDLVSDVGQLYQTGDLTLPTHDDRYVIYRIPGELTRGRGIMGIKSLVPARRGSTDNFLGFPTGLGSTMVNQFGRYSSATMYEYSALSTLSYADGMLQGQSQVKFRYYFYPPNILWLIKPYGLDSGMRVTATFLLKNDPTLLTIPDRSFEKVKELFVLDVRARIYNEYGNLTEIDTPYGSYNLGIDNWSSAESERKELFDQLQSMIHVRNSSMKS